MWVEQKTSSKEPTHLQDLVQNNNVIAALAELDLSYLLAHVEVVSLPFNKSVYSEGDKIDFIYFPLDSVISSLAIFEDGTTVEISMVGREGVVGVAALLGSGSTQHWTRMCIGGMLLRMHKRPLEDLFLKHETAMRILLRSYGSLLTQVSQRAVCNVRHSVMERFCCWLLMLHDRVGGANLKLTQEAIASRLGSRRAGITGAARILQSMGAIEYQRGQLVISNRSILEQIVCECYSILKTKFDAQMAPSSHSTGTDLSNQGALI